MIALLTPTLITLLVVLGITVPLVLLALAKRNEAYSMKDLQGLVFEMYRYGVCFIMTIAFTVLSYGLISGMIANPGNYQGIAGPAIGILLSAVMFFVHWKLKNPGVSA